MSRQTPISTLHRFHPAAFNPLENAEPVSSAFKKPAKSVKTVRRETQVRRDEDTVKGISITLYDVDFAIKRYIEQTIKPAIVENGRRIPVPVQYGSPEKWTSMQKLAALRDGRTKANFPLIVYTRTGVQKNAELSKLASISIINGELDFNIDFKTPTSSPSISTFNISTFLILYFFCKVEKV